MNYPEVFTDEQLIPGQWYWVESKRDGINLTGESIKPDFRPYKVVGPFDTPGYTKAVLMGDMAMWCCEGNFQFFPRYRAYGPIVPPNIHDEHPELKDLLQPQPNEDTCLVSCTDIAGDVRLIDVRIITKTSRRWAAVLALMIEEFTKLILLERK
jgi:hypothetical protein